MTLGEFVNHIKHNSLGIDVFETRRKKPLFMGNIGGYKTSVIKAKIDNRIIVRMRPYIDTQAIFIEVEAPDETIILPSDKQMTIDDFLKSAK